MFLLLWETDISRLAVPRVRDSQLRGRCLFGLGEVGYANTPIASNQHFLNRETFPFAEGLTIVFLTTFTNLQRRC